MARRPIENWINLHIWGFVDWFNVILCHVIGHDDVWLGVHQQGKECMRCGRVRFNLVGKW